jgi:hypothetical protein
MKNKNMEFKETLMQGFLALISVVSVILYFVMDISWVFPLILIGLSYAYDYNLKRKKKNKS